MKKGLIVLLACTLFVSEGFAVSAQMNSMITKAHDHTVKMCGKSNCQCNCYKNKKNKMVCKHVKNCKHMKNKKR